MWSGPRNLSTAMMYAFGNRADCTVWDEPFYAAYLHATGLNHPMRARIIATGQIDPAKVIARCMGPVPGAKPVFYLKHMTQHMIPEFDRSWIADCTNVFLIRHPARVIASYAAKRDNPTLDDIGFRQQAELFDQICQKDGSAPPVLDSFDVRADPRGQLRALCSAIGLTFDPAMLHWPQGAKSGDGIWGQHWYGSVHRSTGFAGSEGDLPEIAPALRGVCEQAERHYHRMLRHRI